MLSSLLMAGVLAFSLLLLYCVSVLVRAYIDTPRVVASATSPERPELRLEGLPDE